MRFVKQLLAVLATTWASCSPRARHTSGGAITRRAPSPAELVKPTS
jgi:hypothetical protein